MIATCPECSEEFAVGKDGSDPFTSFSVNHHYQDKEDFAVSVCGDCAGEAVEVLREWHEAKDSEQ